MLKLEIEDLKELDFDLELTGFELPELEDIMGAGADGGTEGQTDPDAVPEAQEDPVSRLGDVWLLGRHRLMCGDSTDAGNVALLMAGEKADMVFTSPPYNGGRNVRNSPDIFARDKKSARLYGTENADDMDGVDYVSFAQKALHVCFDFADGFIFWNVNYNANSRHEYISQIVPFLDALIEQVCWEKTSSVPFKGCMMRRWEPIYVFSTSGKGLALDSVETNVWKVDNIKSQAAGHKACFPVELPEKAISLTGARTILDPFGGSGSTLIACEKTGRVCRMMELSPRYVDVIVRRWQDFTGQEATLEDGGKTFAQVKEERGG